ncbi:MAG: YabP/YqfC family sporulation protein [Clostridia bacterium]
MDEKTINKHTLILEGNKISITGVKSVGSIYDKEVELLLENSRVAIKGTGLAPSKLNVLDGTIELVAETVSQISYADKHTSKSVIGKLFK